MKKIPNKCETTSNDIIAENGRCQFFNEPRGCPVLLMRSETLLDTEYKPILDLLQYASHRYNESTFWYDDLAVHKNKFNKTWLSIQIIKRAQTRIYCLKPNLTFYSTDFGKTFGGLKRKAW